MTRPLVYSKVKIVKNNYYPSGDKYIGQVGIIYGIGIGIRGNEVAFVELEDEYIGCDFDEIEIVDDCGNTGG